jgi:hypothetical protein
MSKAESFLPKTRATLRQQIPIEILSREMHIRAHFHELMPTNMPKPQSASVMPLLLSIDEARFPRSDLGPISYTYDKKSHVHLWEISVTNMITPSDSGRLLRPNNVGCQTWWAHATSPSGLDGIFTDKYVRKQDEDDTWVTHGFCCDATTYADDTQRVVLKRFMSDKNRAGVIIAGESISHLPMNRMHGGGMGNAQRNCGISDHVHYTSTGKNMWVIKPANSLITSLYICEQADLSRRTFKGDLRRPRNRKQ